MVSGRLRDQLIPILFSILVCVVLVALLWLEVLFINQFTTEKISLQFGWASILVGMTIYLKTSVDFAILIGRMMDKNPGLKGRVGIEIGTAIGNATGTMAVLLLWAFVKDINWLLAIMVVVASLVLLRLAQDSLEDTDRLTTIHHGLHGMAKSFEKVLKTINKLFDPVLSKILPSRMLNLKTATSFGALLLLSFTVPFILGLDDFAGYVPLFNVVNVFGFAIGVFVGHMILNICLFAAPHKTVAVVKNPIISLAGSVAFVGLAAWGLYEAVQIILHH
jgi:hypothetical protein